jgi:flavin-dependent dehydrogenase
LIEASPPGEGPRLGEALAAEVRRPLEQLDLWDRFQRTGPRPAHAIRSAWGSPALHEHNSLSNPSGPGWSVDRSRFDAMILAAAVDRGVRLLRPARVDAVARRPGGGFAIRGEHEGRPLLLEAEYIVDATGRRSTLSRKLGRRSVAHDRLVGVVRCLDKEPGARIEPVLLIEPVERGWWYSAPSPDGRLVAVLMTDVDLLPRRAGGADALWDAQRRAAPHTDRRIGAATPIAETKVRPAHFRALLAPAGDGLVAVGDAAAAIDPLSGRGVLHALSSGVDAAEAILRDHEGDAGALARHGERIAQRFARCLDLRARYYGMETRWPRATFWQRRRASAGAAAVRA